MCSLFAQRFIYKSLKNYSEDYSSGGGSDSRILVMNMTHGDVLYVLLFDPLVPTYLCFIHECTNHLPNVKRNHLNPLTTLKSKMSCQNLDDRCATNPAHTSYLN